MGARLRSPRAIWIAKVVGLAIACYVTGRLGRVSTFPSDEGIALWTSAGIALGGLLLFGNRVWPGVWLGSFLVQLTTTFGTSATPADARSLAIASTIGTGAALQAVAGAWIVRRLLGKTPTFDDLKEVLVLTVVGGFVSSALAATIGAAGLTWATDRGGFWPTWQALWRAEVIGVLVFTPTVLIVADRKTYRLNPRRWLRWIEFAVLFVALPLIVFRLTENQRTVYGAIFVTASILWATLRFGKVGTALSLLTTALLLATNVKTASTLLGTIRVSNVTRIMDAQTLLGAFTITFWILAAILNERERAAKELRENEARFRQFSEEMPHIIWMMTADRQRVLYVNRAFERVFGRKREDLYAASDVWLDGIHPEDRKRVVEARLINHGGGEYCEEFRVVHTDGTVRWLRDRAVPLRDEGGEIHMFAGTAEDITLSRQFAEELARQQSELLHVSRLSSVGQMVATLSHEVAQPMSAIGTLATVCIKALQSEPPEERNRLANLQQWIEDIAAENQRCRAILRRLRDYSRKTRSDRAVCDLNTVLRESAELISNELRRFGVKIRFDLARSLPVVMADRIQLEQVVVNLVTNARDAMLDVDPSRRVIVLRSATDGDAVSIEVEDRGIGLPTQSAGRIFEPFFTTKPNGMGIGLSICKTIVAEHDGEICAFANEHGGATFRILLPISAGKCEGDPFVGPNGIGVSTAESASMQSAAVPRHKSLGNERL
jgi:PAS domain S-box-containing protein